MKLILSDTDYIKNEDSIMNHMNRMDEERKVTIYKNKIFENKKRLVTAGLLLDYMCEMEDIDKPEYGRGQYGKLFLKNREDIKFNLSHSGRYAACAYGEYEVGVDIQEKRVIKESAIVRFLSEREIEELPDGLSQRMLKVNRLWCIKESFIKLIGIGLLYDMRNCIVELEEGRIIDLTEQYDMAYFKDFVIEPDYCLSICSMYADLPNHYKIIDCQK